jgi:hypothetical protein
MPQSWPPDAVLAPDAALQENGRAYEARPSVQPRVSILINSNARRSFFKSF